MCRMQFITEVTRGDVNFDSALCAVLIALAGREASGDL